ncbi:MULTISPECIES: hypothetical protein [Burkholderia]|uniref:hypothetical protein n=1 Tax=Burkholderia TaxID=32008 RepID=UPI0005598727|nr:MULTISPECIES: hypothetical protein [Burkholderia]TCT29410.1 hypothetical protein EC918_10697 [Burkholderia vietnamiensis]SCZ29494.1 hypothetical protein SAMN02787148_107202 [Burkholderia vietnamiensis]SFX71882.1 hypothetical protein SAMN02787160_107203 [Burkholderia vietnamiensis]
MRDHETLDEFEARLKREYNERQEAARRESENVRGASDGDYESHKTAMLSGAKAALMRRPVIEYPDVRGMSDAEYQAQRSKLVRGGR